MAKPDTGGEWLTPPAKAAAGLLAAGAALLITWRMLVGGDGAKAQQIEASAVLKAVEKLETKVDKFIDRVESVEKKQAVQDALMRASHREGR